MTLSGHHRDDGEPAFWGHRLPEQFLGSTFGGEFCFQGVDTPAGCNELSTLDARQTWKLTAVGAILLSPVVDARAADAQILGNLGVYRPRFFGHEPALLSEA